MKIFELNTGISMSLTNEEADFLLQFRTRPSVTKHSLDSRQLVIANALVVKDILRRHKNTDGHIMYEKKNS